MSPARQARPPCSWAALDAFNRQHEPERRRGVIRRQLAARRGRIDRRYPLPGVLRAILGRQMPRHERPHVLERRQRQRHVGQGNRARQWPAPVTTQQRKHSSRNEADIGSSELLSTWAEDCAQVGLKPQATSAASQSVGLSLMRYTVCRLNLAAFAISAIPLSTPTTSRTALNCSRLKLGLRPRYFRSPDCFACSTPARWAALVASAYA